MGRAAGHHTRMHFLITAGPTREYLDPVRYLSNASSGKMGYACAAAAVRRGHRVTLISGPTACANPAGAKVIPVVTCQEMRRAVMQVYPKCDCVIMTAAVSDYRPKHPSKTKIKSKQISHQVELERTEDILAELGQTNQGQVLIGFALEDKAPRQRALEKMAAKQLDTIVLNHPSAIGADTLDVQITRPGSKWQRYDGISKRRLATILVKQAEQLTRTLR